MQTRVITLRYSEELHGFPEDAVIAATTGRSVLQVSEQVFVHDNVPHLVLTLLLDDAADADGSIKLKSAAEVSVEPEAGLADDEKAIFGALKSWRGEVAKKELKPAYAIAKNTQLVRIAKTKPRTMDELKTKADMSDAFCDRCGEDVLAVLSTFMTPNAEKTDGKPWWKLGG